MAGPWEVAELDIEAIKEPRRLHALLQRLLECELAANRLSVRSASVCLNVTNPDGGEDALVIWEGDPPETTHIPHRRTLFQAKTGAFAVADFKKEPFNFKKERLDNGKFKTTKTLKRRVEENLNEGGAYAFFCGGVSFKREDKEKATSELRKALGAAADAIPIRIYGNNDIASWVNLHAAAKLLVLGWLGKADLTTYMTWDDWDAFPRPFPNPPWVPNAQMDDLISQIKAQFREPRQILRLLGQSGLGKSRILLEAFRPPTDPQLDTAQAILSGSMVYIVESEAEKILSSVAPLVKSGASGTIIVDDCREATHQELTKWVGLPNSKLSLITVDYQIEEDRTPSTVQLTSSDKTVIEAILKAAEYRDPDLAVLTEYCDGFPAIAALLASLPPEERKDFYKLTPSEITRRLVWARSDKPYDLKSYEVLKTCSLFAYVGIQSPYGKHLAYVAALCEISKNDFHQRLSTFVRRGVIQTFGAFARVVPIPLAIKLLQDWRGDFGDDRWNALFSDPNMPGDLKDALSRQFTQLGGIQKAAQLVQIITEPTAPFGKAEVLNTAQGSRVFRSLATVNPEAALQTLVREFGSMSNEQLLRVGPGRRNLVWALETIAFNRHLFVPAARLIAQFALAETEHNIGNNAGGVFEHLYFTMLSGTETPPLERIVVIDELLETGDDDAIMLALDAIANAFRLNSATRMLGAERQQGKVLQDWTPETYGDMYDYFQAALERLSRYAIRADESGKVARKAIADGIRTFVQFKRFDMTERVLKDVVSGFQKAWPEAVSAIQDCLKYEMLDDAERERVESWLRILEPKDFAERVRLIISTPPVGNMAKNDEGVWVDLNELAAEALATSLAANYAGLNATIPIVSSGEQREGFVLGKKATEVLTDEQAIDFAGLAFKGLEDAAMQGNAALLCGILAALRPRRPEIVENILDRALASEYVSKWLVYLTAGTEPSEGDLERLYGALTGGLIAVDDFRRFVYGAILKNFSPRFISSYFSRFLKYGVRGAYAALFVVKSYIRDEKQWLVCKALIRKIVSTKGMLDAEQRDTMDGHYFQESVKRLLDDPKEDALAKRLSREIVRVCKLKSFNLHAYHLIQPTVFQLLEKHQESTWPIFKAALSSANAMTDFHLKHAFESNLTMRAAQKSALALVSDEALLIWCGEAPKKAPAFVLSSISLFSVDEEQVVHASPLALTILERYGSDRNVRSAAGGNLESFAISGSATPLYEQRVKLMKQLLHNKNLDVAAWAAEYLTSFEKRLRDQKMRDEEHEKGIFTPLFAGEMPEDDLDGNII